MGDIGSEKSIGLCVAQQETYSKGHRLLTACTLVCVFVCVSMIFAPPEVVYTSCGNQHRRQTQGCSSNQMLKSMFTMIFLSSSFNLSIHSKLAFFTLKTWGFWQVVSNVNISENAGLMIYCKEERNKYSLIQHNSCWPEENCFQPVSI